ncbi:xanthine dehydrogenase family protein molybdopterin-binding subunit [Croceicoccus mobilis]|uniref:Xanthine dehydrogenase n=1 Tax=Croceicoccus mobilis TaxID=1703339 RepID=A0A916Z5C5_9SPHN|nr:xanthine dehydrogenase family protein molybdopterin-binding subunit [Croceicoccus mobilis]GGD74543.1 xanthine dehydrogenase [Croceicoccus mobilis]
MNAYFKQDEPDTRNLLDTGKQGVIGKALSRPEGLAKVTGTAPYSAEYQIDGCLEGVLVTAPFARGRITAIDKKAALAMDGVIAVIDDPRMTTRPAQGTAAAAPEQGPGEVDYFGQPIALIVAETFEQARHAAKNLPFDYEADEIGSVPLDPESAPRETDDGSSMSKGDLAHAMKTAPHTVDLRYRTHGHVSAAIEPHAAIAQWDGTKLTVHAAQQMPNYNIAELADITGLDEENVRLISRYVGGGFGSKLGVAEETAAAAIAAMQLSRPVRVVMSRQQVMQAIGHRSESRQRVRLAADSGGVLTGFGHEALVANLPGESFAEPVLQSSQFLYGGDNRLLKLEIARIHRSTAASVRAPGEAVGMPVLEAAMDVLAEEIGIDPVELRLKNIPEKDPDTGLPFTEHGLARCLKEGAEAFGWDSGPRQPRLKRDGDWWIGTGVASAARVHNVAEAKARVTLNPDGTASVQTDMTDIGTGTYAILSQIAGEMLGLPPEKVLVQLGDTDFPRGPGSGGSWGAASIGSAVLVACEELRGSLAEKAGVNSDELDIADGMLNGQPVSDLLGGKELSALGHYEPGKIADDYTSSGFGAFFAEVRVNRHTGEVRVSRMLGAFAFGRVLNAKTARSQCIGGLVWSIGTALTEALLFDPNDGHIANADLAEYHVPVHRDIPALDVLMLEKKDAAASAIQAKGIGELGMCGGAGAIANAIYNASGARIFEFPMTPDKVLQAMEDN